MVDNISKLLTLIFTIIIELVISWKISHALENWRKTNNKDEDFQSKIIVGIIMISLIFIISLCAMIIHILITNEIIDIKIIYIMLILLIGYISSIMILSKSLQIKFSSEKLDNRKYKKRISQQQKKDSK